MDGAQRAAVLLLFMRGRRTRGMEGKAQIGTVLEKIQKNEK